MMMPFGIQYINIVYIDVLLCTFIDILRNIFKNGELSVSSVTEEFSATVSDIKGEAQEGHTEIRKEKFTKKMGAQ